MNKQKFFFQSTSGGLFILLLIFSGCLKKPDSQNDIKTTGGVLIKDTIWSGIVRVEEDILIPEGVTLIIKPGTKIFIKEADITRNEPLFLSSYSEILVRGRLLAVGEKERPIIFSSEGEADDKIYWAGIIFDRVKESNLEFCEIENAFTGIDCIQSSPVIKGNLIQRNKYGIICSGEGSNPKIIENKILRNNSGISILSHSKAEIIQNVISENEEDGIYLSENVEIVLKDNNIAGNKYDIRR